MFKKEEPTPVPQGSRADIERRLRGDLEKVAGDACAKASWLTSIAAKGDGLEGEIAEELKAEAVFGCKQLHGPRIAASTKTDDETLEPEVFEQPCTRKDAEAKLRERNAKRIDKAAIEDAFARCFAARVKECQTALEAEVDEGVACWRKHPWPEAPVANDPSDVGNTSMCLGELKAVIADLRTCRAKKPAERDACVTPYTQYVPKCVLIDADRAWRAFPGFADVERVANVDAKRRAEREAKIAKETAEREARIAKETERCHGRTTLEFAARVKATPGPRNVPGCRYQVTGNVVSRNNVFVQLVDTTGGLIYLLRTRETFAEKSSIPDRTATFDSIEQAEMEDGTTQGFPVFKLENK